ncbi:MAG: hypothetical protein AB7I30_16355 [Isosphaeraceae bacterium]
MSHQSFLGRAFLGKSSTGSASTPSSGPGPGDALRALLVALVLARGIVWLCVLPPFEGWDEYQHLGHVAHVAETGRRAVLNETRVPSSLLAAVVAHPQPQSVVDAQLGRFGAVGYEKFWNEHDPRKRGTRPPRWNPGPDVEPILLYQAQHAPLYYKLASPLYQALGGAGNVAGVTAWLRGINVALTAAAVVVALGVFRRAFRSEKAAGLAGLVLATHPLFLLNGARVASDALGVFLGAWAVALGLGLIAPKGARRFALRSAGLGVVVGLAVLAKASNLALLPFVGLAWMIGVRRHQVTTRRAAMSALLLPLGFLSVTQAEMRFNLGGFGTLTAMQEAVINRREGRTTAEFLAATAQFDWFTTIRRLWVRELFFAGGWSALRPFPGAIKAYQFGATLGLVGWGWLGALRLLGPRNQGARAIGPFRDPWVPLSFLVIVLSFSAGIGYHMVQSVLAWGQVTTNPWYACPASPWFLGLVVAGGLAWPRGGWIVPVSLAMAGLAVEFVAIWGSMTYVYSGGATGLEALDRLAWSRPSALGTVTLFGASTLVVILVAAIALTLRPGSPASEQEHRKVVRV